MLSNFDHYLLDMASLHSTRHSKLSNSDSIPNDEKVRYSVTNPLFFAENIKQNLAQQRWNAPRSLSQRTSCLTRGFLADRCGVLLGWVKGMCV